MARALGGSNARHPDDMEAVSANNIIFWVKKRGGSGTVYIHDVRVAIGC